MKKHFSAAAVATALFVVAGAANAQSGSATASMAGKVDGYCEISVITTGNGGSIGVNDVLYGLGSAYIDLEISCNDIDGATVTAASTQGGFKLDDDPDGAPIPYLVSVGGFTNGTMDFSSSTVGEKVEPGSAQLADFVELRATITNGGTTASWAGSYDDTLTFSIAAVI